MHWGEETFLDLIEHVADLSRDAPILLLCMARPELLDRRPGWAGGKVNATSVLLEPLAAEETEQLIESSRPRPRRRPARADPRRGRGEPALRRGDGRVRRASREAATITVPPTIQALLAARLDQLDAPERDVLERGSIEGRVFHRGAVQALAPEESQVMARLTSLVRKELVRPDKSELPGEDAFRFRHLLVRDAAYDALPKATRAELHERFAGWLAENGRDLVELDEILGYHLEQACRYRAELGVAADASVAREAAAAAGERRPPGMVRQDSPAAVNLLQRAAALAPPRRDRPHPRGRPGGRPLPAGRMEDALAYASDVAAQAAAAGDRAAELCARIELDGLRTYLEPEGAVERLAATIEEALPVFRAAGDEFRALHRLLRAPAGRTHARQDGRKLDAVEHATRACATGGRPSRLWRIG